MALLKITTLVLLILEIITIIATFFDFMHTMPEMLQILSGVNLIVAPLFAIITIALTLRG